MTTERLEKKTPLNFFRLLPSFFPALYTFINNNGQGILRSSTFLRHICYKKGEGNFGMDFAFEPRVRGQDCSWNTQHDRKQALTGLDFKPCLDAKPQMCRSIKQGV